MVVEVAGCPSATIVNRTKVIVQLLQRNRIGKEGYLRRGTWYPLLENGRSIVDLEHGAVDGAYRRTVVILQITFPSQSAANQIDLAS